MQGQTFEALVGSVAKNGMTRVAMPSASSVLSAAAGVERYMRALPEHIDSFQRPKPREPIPYMTDELCIRVHEQLACMSATSAAQTAEERTLRRLTAE